MLLQSPHSLLRLGMVMVCVMGVMGLTPQAHAAGQKVILARDGKAMLPIVIARHEASRQVVQTQMIDYSRRNATLVAADQALHEQAQTLADMLKRMSGASFDIQSIAQDADAQHAIVIGLYDDFPQLKLQGRFDAKDPLRSEDYLITSHAGGLYIVGASNLALQHGVWDLLNELGYRQYFPGSDWEIVPHTSTLQVAVDRFESPSYHSRLLWYGSGMQEYNTQAYVQWAQRNRIGAGFGLNTGHEYNAIRSRHKEAFDANPQFLAEIDGKHQVNANAKLNTADPDLQKLVIQDAREWFEDHPLEASKSMDPSDFGGWSTTGPSAALGQGTNQALTLTNAVASALNHGKQTPRFVGMYAYYQHQAPPTIQVDPHVIVSFATRFLRPGVTIDGLISGWKAQGLKQVGIRDYYGVFNWDWDMPDLNFQGGSLAYIQSSLPHFYKLGARYFTAETSDTWGGIGLGHYVASRILWNVDEAKQVDAIVNDFLDQCFGPAREPMAQFYDLINGAGRALLNDQMVPHMYTLLGQARALAKDRPAVMKRLDDLALYTRFVELMRTYQTLKTQGQPRQDAFEAVIRHAYRIHESMMVHVTAMYARDRLARADHDVTLPKEAAWTVPADKNPWKNDTPYTPSEIDAFIAQGSSTYKTPFQWQLVLAPDAPATVATKPPALRLRDGVTYLVHAQAGKQVKVDVHCGAVGITFGPAYVVKSPRGDVVAHGRLPVEGDMAITFKAPQTGTYWLYVAPTINSTQIASTNPTAILADSPTYGRGYIHVYRPHGKLYFRVPAGVIHATVRVMGQGKGEYVKATMVDPTGKPVQTQDRITGTEAHDFVIDRPAGAPAEIWSVELMPPSEGYFEDVYVVLGKELPPVLATDPTAIFDIKP